MQPFFAEETHFLIQHGAPKFNTSTSQQRKRHVLKKSHYSAEMLNQLNYFRPRSPFSSPQNIQHTKYSTYLFKNHMLFEHGATKFNIFSISPEETVSQRHLCVHIFSAWGFPFPPQPSLSPCFTTWRVGVGRGWGIRGAGELGGRRLGWCGGLEWLFALLAHETPNPNLQTSRYEEGESCTLSLSLCLYVSFFFSLHSLICFHLMPASISSGNNATLLWKMTALRRQFSQVVAGLAVMVTVEQLNLSWQDLQQEEHATDRMNGRPGAMLEDGVLINPHGNQSQPMSNQNLVMTKRSRRPEQPMGTTCFSWKPKLHAGGETSSSAVAGSSSDPVQRTQPAARWAGWKSAESQGRRVRMRWVVQQSMTGITLSGQINLGSDSGIVVWPRYDRWRPQRLDCRAAKAPWWSQGSTTRESKGADHIWSEVCRQPEHVVLNREHFYLSGGPIALSFLWVNGLARSNWRSALFAQPQCYDEQQCCNGCFSFETQKDEGECWYVADHSSPSHVNPPCSSEEETMCKNVVGTHAFCVAQATNAPSVQHRR